MTIDSILNGRSIALVGPSKHLEGYDLGREINSHDVVCRVGRPLPVYDSRRGTRTDVVYENFWEFRRVFNTDIAGVIDMWKEASCHVRMVYPKHEGYHTFMSLASDLSTSCVSESWYLSVNQEVMSPTKGLCAIADILRHQIKSLTIYGFTFNKIPGYATDYITNPFYHDEIELEAFGSEVTHNTSKEMAYVNRLASDGRLIYGADVFDAVNGKGVLCQS